MKDYRQLIRELPSKTIVCAVAEFNPPTTRHELLVKTVTKLAENKNSDHVIFITSSKNDLLSEEKKTGYLKIIFPKVNFSVVESKKDSIKSLCEKYKNVILVTGESQVSDFKKSLKEYNSVQILNISEKDVDLLDSKMKTLASKGVYEDFKKKLPSTVREIDARRIMNDLRESMGLISLKEQINLVKNKLREEYFQGKVFNVGDIVEHDEKKYTIVKRGSNHLLLKEENGTLVTKWIHDVTPTEEKNMNEELTDKTIKPNDKIKVARIISTMLGIENVENTSNAEVLVNNALRRVKSKTLNPESINIIGKMLRLATEVGIQYDVSLVPTKIKEGVMQPNGTDKIETPADVRSVEKKIEKKANKDKKLPIRFTDFTKNVSNEPEESESDTEKDNESDVDSEHISTQDVDPSEVGHTLVGAGKQDNLRRRKVKYHLGEQHGYRNTLQSVIANPKGKEETKKAAKDYLSKLQAVVENEDAEEKDEIALKKQRLFNMKKKGGFKGYMLANLERSVNEDVIEEEQIHECESDNCSCNDSENTNSYSTYSIREEDETPEEKQQLDHMENMSDEEIDKLVNSLTDDEHLEEYDEDELALVDDETGEEIEKNPEEDKLEESSLMEVLSRTERMKAKFRLRKSAAKRSRSTKIALRRFSPVSVINNRARRLAIKLMKKRLLRGRDPSQLGIAEKERIDKIISKRKNILTRIATKLIPRIRAVEKSRMSHSKFTSGGTVSF